MAGRRKRKAAGLGILLILAAHAALARRRALSGAFASCPADSSEGGRHPLLRASSSSVGALLGRRVPPGEAALSRTRPLRRCACGSKLRLGRRRLGASAALVSRRAAAGKSSGQSDEDGPPNVALLALLVLLAAGPALTAATWTTWWVASGAISLAALLYFVVAAPLLIAMTVAGTLAVISLAGMQFVGFSLLATGLALFSFLLKGSIALAGGVAVYTVATGKLPSLPSPFAADPAPAASAEPKPTVPSGLDFGLEDWDRRFRSKRPDATIPGELIRFEDLSPTSPIAQLSAFIVQEELNVKTGGRTKAELYKEIAVQLMKR